MHNIISCCVALKVPKRTNWQFCEFSKQRTLYDSEILQISCVPCSLLGQALKPIVRKLNIKVTNAEWLEIKKSAVEANKTVSEFCRNRIENFRLYKIDSAKYQKLVNDLKFTADAYNEVAVRANRNKSFLAAKFIETNRLYDSITKKILNELSFYSCYTSNSCRNKKIDFFLDEKTFEKVNLFAKENKRSFSSCVREILFNNTLSVKPQDEIKRIIFLMSNISNNLKQISDRAIEAKDVNRNMYYQTLQRHRRKYNDMLVLTVKRGWLAQS